MTDKTCPSGRCREGSLLLGVVEEEAARVHFIRPAVPVDAAFAATAVEPQRHFRFAEPCATTSCGQWSGGRCGVIDTVVTLATAAGALPSAAGALPAAAGALPAAAGVLPSAAGALPAAAGVLPTAFEAPVHSGGAVAIEGPLPYCSIRSTCRWFHQSGRAACRVCRFVVTDNTEQPAPAS